MTVKMSHHTNKPVDAVNNTVGSVTYKNLGKLIYWLEQKQEAITAIQNKLCEMAGLMYAVEYELKEECRRLKEVCTFDSSPDIFSPTVTVFIPFNIHEYNRGLVYESDHVTHPTLELMASVCIRMHLLEVFVGREYPTFTFKYEEGQCT